MKLEGVKKADVNWEKGEVVVEYDPRRATIAQILQAVNQSGVFKVKGAEDLSKARGKR